MTDQPTYRPRQYISYSTLMSFIRCPRKYFYEKCGITPKDEGTALVYGSAMHKAVPVLLTGGTLEQAVAAFTSVWNPELTDKKHSITHAIKSLAHFQHTHSPSRSLYELLPPPPRPTELIVSDDVADTEIVSMLDIGLPVPLYVRMDGWCQHKHTKQRYVWEFKTMSRLTSSIFDSLEFNPQALTYTIAGRTADPDLAGVMYEGMLKDASKVDGMSHPVPVQEHQVQAILTWLQYWGSLLLACESSLSSEMTFEGLVLGSRGELDPASCFPKNFAGCSSYPMFYQPGSPCEFQSLCRTPDWRSLLPYYDIKPEHRTVELTRSTT